jgi:hypothetical protein
MSARSPSEPDDQDIPFARPLSYKSPQTTPRRASAGNFIVNVLGGGLLVFLGGGLSLGAVRRFRSAGGDPIQWFEVTLAFAGVALLVGGLGMLFTTLCAALGLPSPARWFGRR